MKKWIFIGLGAIVVLIVVIVVVGLSKLGPLVKMAVNTYGPKITGTELRVDDVGISIFSAEAKLKKFFPGPPYPALFWRFFLWAHSFVHCSRSI